MTAEDIKRIYAGYSNIYDCSVTTESIISDKSNLIFSDNGVSWFTNANIWSL